MCAPTLHLPKCFRFMNERHTHIHTHTHTHTHPVMANTLPSNIPELTHLLNLYFIFAALDPSGVLQGLLSPLHLHFSRLSLLHFPGVVSYTLVMVGCPLPSLLHFLSRNPTSPVCVYLLNHWLFTDQSKNQLLAGICSGRENYHGGTNQIPNSVLSNISSWNLQEIRC